LKVCDSHLLRALAIELLTTFCLLLFLLLDTFDMRFSLRHCHVKDYHNFTTFTCHHEPTYLLARHCNDDYYGYKGLCCKIDSLFNFLMNEPDNTEFFKKIKYVFQADDDLFIRVDQFLKWISLIDKSGLGHLPIIGNNEPSINFYNRWQGIWHINGCKEISSTGWYHPFFINKPAMERLKVASASWGLMDTCRNFDVSQDVGGDIYFWLFGLYHIMVPGKIIFLPFLLLSSHFDLLSCFSFLFRLLISPSISASFFLSFFLSIFLSFFLSFMLLLDLYSRCKYQSKS
jgi:hypothetical protein